MLDRLVTMLAGLIEGVGVALFLGLSIFVLIGGMAWQIISGNLWRKKPTETVSPPITPKVEEEAKKAGDLVKKPAEQSSIDFFNKLGKP
jgi:hypothetical protein